MWFLPGQEEISIEIESVWEHLLQFDVHAIFVLFYKSIEYDRKFKYLVFHHC